MRIKPGAVYAVTARIDSLRETETGHSAVGRHRTVHEASPPRRRDSRGQLKASGTAGDGCELIARPLPMLFRRVNAPEPQHKTTAPPPRGASPSRCLRGARAKASPPWPSCRPLRGKVARGELGAWQPCLQPQHNASRVPPSDDGCRWAASTNCRIRSIVAKRPWWRTGTVGCPSKVCAWRYEACCSRVASSQS